MVTQKSNSDLKKKKKKLEVVILLGFSYLEIHTADTKIKK